MPLLTLWTGLGMKPLPSERWTLPGWEIRWLEIEPPAAAENMEEWAQRLLKSIPVETDLLGGFSLGAQLALKHREMAPDRFPELLILSGFVHRRQWHVLLRFLRAVRIPQLLLLLPPWLLLLIVKSMMLLLPEAERRRFNIVLTLWPATAWRKVLRFLLNFETESAVQVLQVCGAEDILLKPAPPAVRLAGAGHFLLPSEGSKIGFLLQDWWNGRGKTG
jgi:pimeloyl-ACP methyl ester carboxylesterase